MTTIILQCGTCKYGPTLKWVMTDEQFENPDDDGDMVCSQYPVSIPSYVEEGEHRCPKFEEKK